MDIFEEVEYARFAHGLDRGCEKKKFQGGSQRFCD